MQAYSWHFDDNVGEDWYMDTSYILITIILIAAVTAALRFLPFLIFGKEKEAPPWITYLGNVLPYAIMGMLVVYCLKGTDFTGATHGIPEMISCVLVVVLHAVKKNTLLSIVAGTACYMI